MGHGGGHQQATNHRIRRPGQLHASVRDYAWALTSVAHKTQDLAPERVQAVSLQCLQCGPRATRIPVSTLRWKEGEKARALCSSGGASLMKAEPKLGRSEFLPMSNQRGECRIALA